MPRKKKPHYGKVSKYSYQERNMIPGGGGKKLPKRRRPGTDWGKAKWKKKPAGGKNA